ncbi:hypothetical protein [Belliella calami]|uniref:hypothetical protein n=1 Tax=Belliella calami TaxID=2923436 RepID=UPI001F4A8D27|nr:hypothetical protein [Belliella calami]
MALQSKTFDPDRKDVKFDCEPITEVLSKDSILFLRNGFSFAEEDPSSGFMILPVTPKVDGLSKYFNNGSK